MARTKSSNRWLKEHFVDAYVKKSWQDGYRSRAAYKLLEINERDQLLRPGITVLDLGAAPGGWAQIASKILGDKGHVIATDILEMEPLPHVEFLQGDFREQPVFDQLLKMLEGRPVALVISDMAPNISGVTSVDQPRSIYLAELALDMARRVLMPGGDFLVKVFQGSGDEALRKQIQASFQKILVRKPKASRPQSREVYILARGFRP
jgi:23S rRNA (uridine2552-2'-O)-methyltransferase